MQIDRSRNGGGGRRGRGGGSGHGRGRGRRLKGIPGLIKLIVRHLPPSLSEDAFREVTEPFGIKKAAWSMFVPGEEAVRPTASSKFSFAYVGFSNMVDAVNFKSRFGGYRFANGRSGTENFAVVERAPFHPVPRPPRKRMLSSERTIESDPMYKTFLSEYEARKKEEKSRASISLGQTSALFASDPGTTQEPQKMADKKKGTPPIVTALIEDVRAKRREKGTRKASKGAAGGKNSKRKGRKEPRMVPRSRSINANKGKGPNTILKRERAVPTMGASSSSSGAVSGPGVVVKVSATTRKRLSRNERKNRKQRQEQQQQLNDKHKARAARSSVKPNSRVKITNGNAKNLKPIRKPQVAPKLLRKVPHASQASSSSIQSKQSGIETEVKT